MKSWLKFSFSLSRQLEKYLPQTAGRIRRWKDDVLLPKLKPVKEKIEFHSASKNIQRDFEKAVAPANATYSLPYEAAKQRLDKRKTKAAKKAVVTERQQNASVSTKAAQQPNAELSAKQDFAKSKVSNKVSQDFNKVAKNSNSHGISK